MKHLLSIFLLFCMTAVNAQTILKGDMNNDEQVSIADVTSLVNVILGKAPQEEISVGGDPYKVDNSLVVGTWVAPDHSSFALNEDGTTTFPDAATFKFRPVQGVLTFYDASDNPIKAIVLNEVTSDYLMAVDYATNVFTKYTKEQMHEYVDLGLPSGTLWATCNIGANSPEDYGDYFAWGETEGYNSGKTYFDWSTYKWCNGSFKSLTKYNNSSSFGIVDKKTELDLEDDAAYINWGPEWRMPSIDQLKELIKSSYTTTETTTLNGVDGYRITSKSNGNSIFLPDAGYRANDRLITEFPPQYWSRTLEDSIDAWSSLFDSGGCSRDAGLSVRPVRLSE